MGNREACSAIILAAGNSERMGVPKLSLRFRGDTSFIARCTQEFLNAGCREIALVVNEQGFEWIGKINFPENVIVVPNSFPEFGRFHSIQLGLAQLGKGDPVFIHNVDNPFIHTEQLLALERAYHQPAGKETAAGGRVVIPHYKGRGGHPVLISPEVGMAIRGEKQPDWPFREFLKGFQQIKVPVNDPGVLVNINTIGDYRAAGLPFKTP